MQTKNVNMAPLNNCVQEGEVHTVAPPLPPRGPAQTPVRLSSAEVEGYGPYKPVPPPKPLPTSGCHSPPPYRMPPYPLYSEPTIPGAATGTESAYIPSQNNNLHTHSSKFPIEREVILSSTDKNSKIPILNEYRKRPKTAIAPDAPNKQLAWTEEKNKGLDHTVGNHHPHPQDTLPTHQLYKAQPMTLIETSRESEISPINRPQDHINGYASQPSVSTGAVPRTPAHSTPENDSGQNKAFPTRTYHTIKDMISSRFTKQQRSEMVQKQDELSPQSQLRQHGVYLASAQQQSRAMNPGSSAASAEVMRRNQEIRQQIERERRGENDDGGFHEMVNRNYHGGSRHSILDSDTPRRNPNDTPYQSRESETRALAIEMTPGSTRRMDTRTPIQPEIRPGEMYGRMPTSQSIYYQESGGYGIPGTRKSLADAENARRAAETERVRRLDENRSAFQSVNQQPPTPHQRMTVNPELTPRLLNKDDRMQSLGVYVSRNPNEQSQSVNKNPDTRTPEFRHRTDFIDKRSVCQSNERLDIVGDSASAAGVTNSAGSSGAVGHSTNAGVVGHSASASGVGHVENRSEAYQKSKSMSELEEGRAKDDCVRPDLDDDDAGFSKGGASSDYEKLRGGAQSDSGRGSTVYSSGKAKTERQIDTSPEPNTTPGPGDSQWVDIVENELRHILDPKLHHNIANSTLSESISSMTPPLPPLSPGGSSDEMGPAFKHKSLPYGSKPEYSAKSRNSAGPGRGMWSARVNSKDKSAHHRSSNKRDNLQSKLPPTLLCSSLELDSMLDDENNSSDEDLSTTIDTSDTRAIRKQLEGLENMYSEVLKLLGVKKQFGRYQPSDPRINKRRLYGSMSSLPSSVSSRPMRDKRRHDERKKVKDMKGINKRFQRLESHVVTLARSVAHLSSEMRTQHLMMQEMEVIRGELAALRTQSNMAAVRSQSMPRALNRLSVEQSNSNPERVKKLTKFFGDEPPLLRLFLKKLGYEKYASLFENERVGLVELPYMTEERLHKLGIPLGPRLRIMQEAQMGFAAHENTLCIV